MLVVKNIYFDMKGTPDLDLEFRLRIRNILTSVQICDQN